MVSTVTVKGQVTIPQDIREQLHIKAGTRLDWRIKKGKLEVVKLAPVDPGARVGSLKHLYTSAHNEELLTIVRGTAHILPEDLPD